MAVRILGDRVMIDVAEAPETEGGIVIPETAQEKPTRGTVVAVGEGHRTDSGELIKPDVEEGDTVVFSEYGGHDVTIDGKEYKILESSGIYGKIV